MRVVRRASLVLALTAGLTGLVACGGDETSGTPGPSLSPAAEAGRQLARTKGCAACHGTNGEGNVGPAFVGLYGTEVELQDGTTVIADDDYLIRSITDPGADKVKGFSVPMPETRLSEAEIASLVDYIRELGGSE